MPTFSIFHCDERFESVLYNLLHHSRTGLSKGLFALQLTRACGYSPEATKCQYSPQNKLQYSKYKYYLSHLLIDVQSDAVSGWLMLASFFYAHKNYFASLPVIYYTLQKYTDEKILTGPFNDSIDLPLSRKSFNHIQRYVLNLMKKEKLFTILKTLNMYPVLFNPNSSLTPQVLQIDFKERLIGYHPLSFAYFLCFLCNYRLHDITSCIHYLQQLCHFCSIKYAADNLLGIPVKYFLDANIFCGIAHQLMGNTHIARQRFQQIAGYNKYNISTAATRLSRLN
ncbi:unnamed protein product [Mytilus coruscus]|uniref:Uncharacterized protein n=1 Tax=Mytilus coruscus TaxID=42192 RepID=A0A6J8AGJ8_MYTCO|nr:unnamed protein product [Mytilus coruscus]